VKAGIFSVFSGCYLFEGHLVVLSNRYGHFVAVWTILRRPWSERDGKRYQGVIFSTREVRTEAFRHSHVVRMLIVSSYNSY
jgi:hypothetical protein